MINIWDKLFVVNIILLLITCIAYLYQLVDNWDYKRYYGENKPTGSETLGATAVIMVLLTVWPIVRFFTS